MKDTTELEKDMKEHPALKFCRFPDVKQLVEHLTKVHRGMLQGQYSCFGYLYEKQVETVRKLKKELEECKKQIQNK